MEFRKKSGELIFKVCPECNNQKWNFQVCLKSGRVGKMHCWVCGLRGNIKRHAIADSKYREYFRAFQTQAGAYVEDIKEDDVIFTPEGFQRIMFCTDTKILAYLNDRGLSAEDAERLGVMYKGVKILFPLKESGQIVYWTMKDIISGRYTLPEIQKQEMVWHIKNGSGTIVVVEGIFDAVKVWQAGYDVLLLLGKELYKKAEDYIRKLKARVVIGLDADAKNEAHKMALKLEKDVEVCILKFTEREEKADMDLGEMEVGEVKKRIKALKPLSLKEKVQQKIKR